MSDYRQDEAQLSGGAAGGLFFAACIIGLIGFFQIIAGLAAIIDDDFLVVAGSYAFDLDTTVWGVIHLLLGLLLVGTSWGLLSRAPWAVMTAIFLALLSAVANFFFIPYYPFWAIVVIALDVWVLWALTRPGAMRT